MKIKFIFISILLFMVFDCFSQQPAVNVNIHNLKVDGVSIGSNPIDFGTKSQITLRFSITITKGSTYYIGNTSLRFRSSTVSGAPYNIEYFISNLVADSFSTSITLDYEFPLYASDFNFTGGVFYAILAQNGTPGVIWRSNEIPVTKFAPCNLPAPGLNIAAVTQTYVNLTWSNVQNASGYRIYYRKASEVNNIQYVDAVCCNKIVSSLEPGTSYVITIYPKCGDQISSNSSVRSVTTNCLNFTPAATNITATPSTYGYIINCTPAGYYDLEFVNLVNGDTGNTSISTGSNSNTGNNFFYYVPPSQSFKFRLRKFGNCNLTSEWVTIGTQDCVATNYPSNLLFSTQSVCGSTPGRFCGYGRFSWTAVANATQYGVEYMGINLTNVNQNPHSGSFQTTQSTNITWNTLTPSGNTTGTWIFKYRVRARCPNGVWSDFSPWSANFPW